MNKNLHVQLMPVLAILLLVSLIIYDMRYHFDNSHIAAKIENQSAQRNWSVFFPQTQIFYNSSFRYEQDFAQLKLHMVPNRTLLTDLATSYYATAALPVYVVNIHRHQGRYARANWPQILDKRYACYLEKSDAKKNWNAFLRNQRKLGLQPHLQLEYILLNKDKKNRNLRTDCLSARSGTLETELPKMADLLYEGEFLNLYKIIHADDLAQP